MKKGLLAFIAGVLLYTTPVFALDPVVFVHGYSGSTIVNFSAMIGWFKQDGYPSNYLYYYTYNTIPGVVNGAYILKAKVDDCLAKTGKTKVDLVCHSMGGLVARYYMKYLGGANKVNQVVYIATPHKGTYIAYGDPLTQAAKDLRPGSDIVNMLLGYCPGMSLWSSCDEIVIPNSSANYGYAVCAGCLGHIASTWTYSVYTKTRDYIKP